MVRNTRCSGCQRPVERGKCLQCSRKQHAERWHARFPDMGRRRTLREQALELENGTRRCTRCASWKPLGEFYRNGNRLHSHCKVCHGEAARRRTAEVRARRRAGDEHLRALRREQKRRARTRAKALETT